MARVLVVVALLVLAASPAATAERPPFEAVIRPLSDAQQERLRGRFWRPGCPVSLTDLRVLTMLHVGFDDRVHTGQLVVNAEVAAPLARVFRRLYELRFPIRHLRFSDLYGPPHARPADGDVSGSFACRQAVPSPCTGGRRTGTWSNHAYGYAVDLNPAENPYVGCGMTRDPKRRPYMDRSRLRKGMVTPAVVQAFRAIGWGWGGSWSGETRDYMHFSVNGR